MGSPLPDVAPERPVTVEVLAYGPVAAENVVFPRPSLAAEHDVALALVPFKCFPQ
jgi:hypothetical protein